MIDIIILSVMFTLLSYMIYICFKNTKDESTHFNISNMSEIEAAELTKELSEISDTMKKQLVEAKNKQK
jgi:hypothetical protein